MRYRIRRLVRCGILRRHNYRILRRRRDKTVLVCDGCLRPMPD